MPCSCLSCFSMNKIKYIICPTHTGSRGHLFEKCPAHIGSRGYMIQNMPGPHRVTGLHNRPITDNHKQLGLERRRPTSEQPSAGTREEPQSTPKTRNTHAHTIQIYRSGKGINNISFWSIVLKTIKGSQPWSFIKQRCIWSAKRPEEDRIQ